MMNKSNTPVSVCEWEWVVKSMYVPNWSAKALEEWKEIRSSIEDALGYQFRDPEQLQEAMTHRSFAHEAKDENILPYERLEFLGDAVLELIISHILWERFPKLPEGDLTRLRAELVKKGTLANVARRLDLGSMILLGKGERQRGGHERASILADALEALLGSIFLDGGISAARIVCLHLFRDEFAQLDIDKLPNYKNRLQELAAIRQLPPPQYHLLKVEGPEHLSTFVMEVSIGPDHQAEGRGSNKKAATQEAAHRLLERLDEKEQSNT